MKQPWDNKKPKPGAKLDKNIANRIVKELEEQYPGGFARTSFALLSSF